jgi:hypothetical protein
VWFLKQASFFLVESFDDIPRIMADIKQKIPRANITISSITSLLEITNDDKLWTETRNMKRHLTACQDCLREIGIILNVDSFKKCSKAISDTKSHIHETRDRDREQQSADLPEA